MENAWMPEQDSAGEKRRVSEMRLVGVVERLGQTKDGLFFLRWMMDLCGLFSAVYPSDHAMAAYVAGRREIGLELLRLARKSEAASNIIREDKNA